MSATRSLPAKPAFPSPPFFRVFQHNPPIGEIQTEALPTARPSWRWGYGDVGLQGPELKPVFRRLSRSQPAVDRRNALVMKDAARKAGTGACRRETSRKALTFASFGNTSIETGITEREMATTVTVKGQVTLPKAVREAAGIRPGDRVSVRVRPEGGVIVEAEASVKFEDAYRARLEDMSRRRPIRGVSTEDVMRMTRGDD